MTAVTTKSTAPAFCDGIQHFADALPDFDTYGKTPAIGEGQVAIAAQPLTLNHG